MMENYFGMPRIGDFVPDFEAVTTKEKIKFSVPPPKTLAGMDEQIADKTCEKVDFYLARKTIKL